MHMEDSPGPSVRIEASKLAGDDVSDEKKESSPIARGRLRSSRSRSRSSTPLNRMTHGQELLPIFPYKEDLLDAIKHNTILVIVSETGSGKTTQLPQYILDGFPDTSGKNIVVTQPRRVAAITVAHRVAEEQHVELGDRVGYAVRFDSQASGGTRLKYVTDGILLRECLSDDLLSQYTCVVLDEAHERSLDSDVLMGLLKLTLKRRKDLKLLIMSATLDVSKFSRFFGDCPVFSIPGRLYEVRNWSNRRRCIAAS